MRLYTIYIALLSAKLPSLPSLFLLFQGGWWLLQIDDLCLRQICGSGGVESLANDSIVNLPLSGPHRVYSPGEAVFGTST